MRGRLISIEGTEGAGKTTVLQRIERYLREKQISVCMTREPGGTQLAEEIRRVLLHPAAEDSMLPETELLLMFAGRAQHIHYCIEPALQKGQWVVTDRYVDASYAYQGGGREINPEIIQFLDEWIVGDLIPDLTILLDVSVETGLSRAALRSGKKDRIEREQTEFFERVRYAYLDRAMQFPERVKVVDARLPLPEVEAKIVRVFDEFFASHTS